MPKSQPKRVVLLDELRGFSILLVVVYHFCFDVVYLFGINFSLFLHPLVSYVHLFFASLFIVISGVVSVYSRNNWKRGGFCLAAAMGLTLVTALVVPEETVFFGILHLLAVSILLYALFSPLLKKIRRPAGSLVFFALFLIFFHVEDGFIGLKAFPLLVLPPALYQSPYLFFLGFPNPRFASGDYYPLIPWLFLFFAGALLGLYFREGKAPPCFYRSLCPFLARCGRLSLWIYLFHQPLLLGGLTLFFWFFPR